MKLNELLSKIEYGTMLRIYDGVNCETLISERLLYDTYDKYLLYGEKSIIAINTNDKSVDFEIVVN